MIFLKSTIKISLIWTGHKERQRASQDTHKNSISIFGNKTHKNENIPPLCCSHPRKSLTSRESRVRWSAMQTKKKKRGKMENSRTKSENGLSVCWNCKLIIICRKIENFIRILLSNWEKLSKRRSLLEWSSKGENSQMYVMLRWGNESLFEHFPN